jgi:hypothetical protein
MRLDIRLTHRFLDQLWCQAVVAFLFKDTSLRTEYLSRLDEKLTGALSQLIDTNFLTGKRDELLLVASQERIRADKLLFVGLGSSRAYSFEILSSAIKKISSTLEKLGLYEFGIMVPWAKGIRADYIELTRLTIITLIGYYGIEKRDTTNVVVKIIVTIDEKISHDLRSLAQELRAYLDLTGSDYSIAIDNRREAK